VKMVQTERVRDTSKSSLRMEDYGIGGLTSQLEPLGDGEDQLCLLLTDIVCQPGN